MAHHTEDLSAKGRAAKSAIGRMALAAWMLALVLTPVRAGGQLARTGDPAPHAWALLTGEVGRVVLPYFAAATAGGIMWSVSGRVEAMAKRGVGRTADGVGVGAWGGADYHALGEPGAEELRWEGDILTGYVGADARPGGGFLVGVAGSQSTGKHDFTDNPEGWEDAGTYETDLIAVTPYVAWSPGGGGYAVWAAGSLGWGELAVDDGVPGRVKTRMRMTAGALGGSHRLMSSRSHTIDLRSEGWLSQVWTEETEDLEALELEMWRARFFLEWTQLHRFEAGHEVDFMLQGGMRYDEGDAANGMGLEFGGGFRYVSPSRAVTMEARARARMVGLHGYEEWGGGGRIRIGRPGEDRGLSLRLAPAWGESLSGVGEVWKRGVGDGRARSEGGVGRPRLTAEVEHGLPVLPCTAYGLLHVVRGGMQAVGTGVRYEVIRVLDLGIEGTRETGGAGRAGYRVAATGHWWF